jgi:hypothetical protein
VDLERKVREGLGVLEERKHACICVPEDECATLRVDFLKGSHEGRFACLVHIMKVQ